jgi:heavy metal translocating P-type ATPase
LPASLLTAILKSRETLIAILAVAMIALHLLLRYAWPEFGPKWLPLSPLWTALVLGGIPLVWGLLQKMLQRQFGSDLLAGISIVTSVLLGEYLAGTLVVLMLSGGEALEAYAVRSASSVLRALSKRMPAVAHRKLNGVVEDIPLDQLRIGDTVIVFPHETCPIDGTVLEGHGVMDESYLTGEPYMLSKSPGSAVLSGAINGEMALMVKADKLAVDSRYAKIMEVMQAAEEQKPQMRRLADKLGSWYTPLAVAIAIAAWIASGEPLRFLAVLVVATPCPLLIAIPVAIIGSISLAAKRAIIIRDPSALEVADTCRTIIFDKTGTLTYGEPNLVGMFCPPGVNESEVLALVGSLEVYSKHPLALALVRAAREANSAVHEVTNMSERPGEGLRGSIAGRNLEVTSRKKLLLSQPEAASLLPPSTSGLECVVLIDGRYAATCQFRDTPRKEGRPFIEHLSPRHGINRTMIVSGDRQSEVEYLAKLVGIQEVYASQSPEQKLEIIRKETEQHPTIYVGDGINDAPALLAASIGIAFGQNSDVTTEAADAVIIDSSLQKVDEFLHIGRRMRQIALQSAVGGMGLSILGMLFAAFGYLPPVAGAVAQEVIDVLAVLNALRVAIPPSRLADY